MHLDTTIPSTRTDRTQSNKSMSMIPQEVQLRRYISLTIISTASFGFVFPCKIDEVVLAPSELNHRAERPKHIRWSY